MFNVTEMQAIVLAGGAGSRMYPLTDNTPKALVPVANKPLIYFTVKNLEREGFKGVRVNFNRWDLRPQNAVPLARARSGSISTKSSISMRLSRLS